MKSTHALKFLLSHIVVQTALGAGSDQSSRLQTLTPNEKAAIEALLSIPSWAKEKSVSNDKTSPNEADSLNQNEVLLFPFHTSHRPPPQQPPHQNYPHQKPLYLHQPQPLPPPSGTDESMRKRIKTSHSNHDQQQGKHHSHHVDNADTLKLNAAHAIESMPAISDHPPSEVQAIAAELKKMDETRGVSKSIKLFAKALKVYALLHDGQMPNIRFKVEPKDTDWPSEFQSGYNLGKKLSNWRSNYKSDKIPPEDIAFFEEHGVQWKSEIKKDGTWISELARELRAYHLAFPDSKKIKRKDLFKGYKLGEKVNQARRTRQKNYLTLDQFNMLENAGIQWGNGKYPPLS